MNAPKPTRSLAGRLCPTCHHGHLEFLQIEHVEDVAEDNPLTIPGVWVNRCDHCGEVVFPGDTVHFIESVVAEHTEQLTPRELERVREDLGVATQDEMSQLLGLGTKTYHKWESGAQFPTRSMSYYIRLLAEFPQAFDWLRCRAWRNKNRLLQSQAAADFKAMFPDLKILEPTFERPQSIVGSPQGRTNPALGLTRVAFAIK